MDFINTIKTKNCSNCGTPFSCGDIDDTKRCWCNDYPAFFTPSDVIDCLCPSCLKNACSQKIDNYTATITIENAIDNKAKDLPKTSKLIEGLDYYMEDGKFVFKAWYHLKRGNCCKSGCRHCPYGFKK